MPFVVTQLSIYICLLCATIISNLHDAVLQVNAVIIENELDIDHDEINQLRSGRPTKRSFGLQHMQRKVISRPDHLPPINYGDQHPFDLYQKHGTDSYDSKDHFYNHHQKRSLQKNTTVADPHDALYQPIRIKFEYTNLKIRDYPGDSEKKHMDEIRIKTLKTDILPGMGLFYKHLLAVVPVKDAFKIEENECFGYVEVPNRLLNKGAEDVDLLIFVAGFQAVEGNDICGEHNDVLAAAGSCSLDQHDRPVTGFINFCLDAIKVSSSGVISQAQINNLISVGTHEFAHVLGINGEQWKFFRHPVSGDPVTKRPFKKEKVTCVNGKEQKDIVVPSCHTLQKGIGSNGMPYYEIVTPTVRQVVRNQFGCQTLLGARLENQPTNELDCFGSHWDERYFYTETLSAYYSPEADYFSALTLALLEDSGWYRANYANAETSPFGHGAGCEFVEQDCIKKNDKASLGAEVPVYGAGFFCDNVMRTNANDDYEFDYTCDPSHVYKAACDLWEDKDGKLPHKYFEKANIGPRFFWNADYCPIAQLETIDCRVKGNSRKVGEKPGEVYGQNSLCYNSKLKKAGNRDFAKTSMCFETVCNDAQRRVEVHVLGTVFVCQYDFQGLGFVYLGDEVRFECPRFSAACPHIFCPANCSGRGICNYMKQPFPACECFDPNDKSADCQGTPMAVQDLSGECPYRPNESSDSLFYNYKIRIYLSITAIVITGILVLGKFYFSNRKI